MTASSCRVRNVQIARDMKGKRKLEGQKTLDETEVVNFLNNLNFLSFDKPLIIVFNG